MRKSLFILMSIILVLSLFVACAPETENIPNEINNNNDENENILNNIEMSNGYVSTAKYAPPAYIPEGYDMSERIDINMMLRGSGNPATEQYTLIQDEIENLLNINFEFGIMSSTNVDMDLVAAANILPECGWVYLGSSKQSYQNYQDGLTRTIPMEYVKEFAPWYWQGMLDDKSCHPTMLAPGTDDEYFTLFAIRYGMLNLGTGAAVRLDWLENLGYDPLGNVETILADKLYITDEAYRLDQFYDIIYEFTFSDPDSNNENDTYGYNAAGLVIDSFNHSGTLYSAFDARKNFCEDENGWAVPLMYSNQNYKFLSILGEWKNQGLIPSNFATKAINDARMLWGSGNVGTTSFEVKNMYTSFTQEQLQQGMFWNEQIPLNIFSTNEEVKVILTPPLLDNNGEGGHGRPYENFLRSVTAGYFFVRDDVSDEKLKRILMVMDYISMNPSGLWFCRFGGEDLNWIYDKKLKAMVVLDDQSHLADNLVWKQFDYFLGACEPNYAFVGYSEIPPWKGGGYTSAEKEERANLIPYEWKGINDSVEYAGVNSFCEYYQQTNWPSLNYPYVDMSSTYPLFDELEFRQIESMRAYSRAYKTARTALANAEGDIDTIWDNLMATLNNCGYQEYLEALNNNAYLRDELFFEGIALPPAEKFPLE